MKQTISIQVPDNWNDITLKKYLALQSDLENYKDDEEAQTAFTLYHLCELGLEELNSLSKESYQKLVSEIAIFVSNANLPLQRIITIDGVEYGFEPNLSKMSYGAFVDISKYDGFTIDKNWAKIMSILYRPIENKKGDTYSIKPYDGSIDDTKWLEVGMDIHFGCLFFFVNLSKDLLNYTLNSTMQIMPETLQTFKSTLGISGNLIQQLLNSQITTLGQSTKSSKNP